MDKENNVIEKVFKEVKELRTEWLSNKMLSKHFREKIEKMSDVEFANTFLEVSSDIKEEKDALRNTGIKVFN